MTRAGSAPIAIWEFPKVKITLLPGIRFVEWKPEDTSITPAGKLSRDLCCDGDNFFN
jgi:hypothetical protein